MARLRAAFAGAGVKLIVAESDGGGLRIDPAADIVCCAGGDGTLRHVVAAVRGAGRRPPVAVYPFGTINLLARELGCPARPAAFVRRLLRGAGRTVYTAAIGDVPVVVCASVGPDSRAVAAVSDRAKARLGRWAYPLALAAAMLPGRWHRPRLEVSHAGGTIACEAAYVMKGRHFGGRAVPIAAAHAADPCLHVVAFDRMTRLRFLAVAVRLCLGRPVAPMAAAPAFACAALTIAGEAGVPVQADGDAIAATPCRIAIDETPLTFL